jgi:outer membrane receptor protein involved in Fe transport
MKEATGISASPFLTVAGFAFLLQQPFANAQQTPASLEEVIVTATKRETRLQETPIAITAFTAKDLEKLGAFDAVDIGQSTPGLYAAHLSDFGSPVFFIRGVGTDSFSIGSDQSVGVYLDGVYIGRNVASIVSLLDLERVEVLKGPQGTLYGRNTTGGAINYISRKPSDKLRSEVTAGVGNYDMRKASAVLSGPLVEGRLQAKIGFEHNEHAGYIRNLFDGTRGSNRDSNAAIAQFRWLPADPVEVMLNLDWGQDDTAGTYVSNLTPSFDPFGIFGSPQPFPVYPASAKGSDLDCAKSTGCRKIARARAQPSPSTGVLAKRSVSNRRLRTDATTISSMPIRTAHPCRWICSTDMRSSISSRRNCRPVSSAGRSI